MMLQSSHLLDKSENWDTNWARKVLKIPQDQSNKIDNIPEWSTNQIFTTENTASVGVHIVTTEKAPLLQCATVLENLNKTSAKYTGNPKVSNLQESKENKLKRSASLNYLNLFEKPSEYTGLKSADSVPNIKFVLLSDNLTISETVSQKPKTSTLSSSRFNLNKKRLKGTSIVSRKLNKMDFCSTSFSQPEINYGSIPESIKPVEKLTDRILNHRYLKGSVNSTKSDETEPFEVSVEGEGNPKVLDKRLMLLEKRFSSPGKCASAEESSKIQELSKPILQAPKDAELQEQNYVPVAVSSAGDLHNDGHIQGPSSSATVREPDREKENDGSNYGHSSCRNQAVTPSVSDNNESIIVGVNHEETFGSQLIPCGQPLPAEASSHSQPKKTNTETCDVSTDVSNVAASAVAGNVDIQKSPSVRGRISGTKRKRKSKGETPKRIKDAHAIRFTADQVRNMLEMIKMLHST